MDWLERLGLDYEEKDATSRPDITTVPVITIGKQEVVGFDRPAIKKILKTHGLI